MRALGEGLSYLIKDDKAYLLGKLNHDSFVEVPATIKDRNFAFTIDTRDEYLDYVELEKIDQFRNFKFPIKEVYDIEDRNYSVEGVIDNSKDIIGKMIVQKVVYSNGNEPVGYIFFEFELHESERKEDYILVYRSHSNGHTIKLFS